MSLGRRLNDIVEATSGRRLMKRPARVPGRSERWPPKPRPESVYLALAELHRRRSEPIASTDLRLAELKLFSQNGEDGVIDAILRTMGSESEFFVEFGVQDGTECNTRYLAEVLGYRGLYIEPHEDHHAKLAKRWQRSDRVDVVRASVTPSNINEIFNREHVPSRFGVLSIDIDGQDYWVWQALSEKYQPDLVVIECNTSHPADSTIVERKGLAWTSNHSNSFGASVEAVRALGRQKGYQLVHVDLTGVNAFLVRDDRFDPSQLIGITDRGANYHLDGVGHRHEPVRPTVTPEVVHGSE